METLHGLNLQEQERETYGVYAHESTALPAVGSPVTFDVAPPGLSAHIRNHLETQDVRIQLKEDILVLSPIRSPRANPALELNGAFDRMAHGEFLQHLARTGCGQRT